MNRRPVRARIRRALPADTFAPRPWRALLIPVWAAVAAALAVTIVHAGLPWWVDVGLALLLGQAFGSLGFTAHEVLHGATIKGRRIQDVLGFIGFMPFFVSPTLWREWHNRRHHSHANQGSRDPDSFGDVGMYVPGAPRNKYHFLLPGSGHPLSVLWPAYWFTTHNFVVLAWMSKYFRRFNRKAAMIETALAGVAWLGIVAWAVVFGGWEAVLVSVVPMLVGNALVMGYIATNHMMRPELDHDEPVDNSMSVRVPWVLDVLHGWFSHHVEHHLFPSMSPAMAPRVREWLEAETPDRYVAPAWHKALWWLYRTPRPHDGPDVLVDPEDPTRRVDLGQLTRELRDDRFERLAPKHGAPSP